MAKEFIICVDDEKIILDSLQGQLLRNLEGKFNYEFAESAEEAMDLFIEFKQEGQHVHTIISDWLMPGMKGDALLSWVNSKFPSTNKILLTGHMDNETVKSLECCNNEDIACIYKPWAEEALINLILNPINHE